VVGCPKPETAAAAVRVALARSEGQEKADRLAKSLAPQLRTDLLALLKGGRKEDAIRAYRDVSGQDPATAKAVIEALEKDAPR
ncbi:MAG: hypothetical protein OEW94_16225, partial [Betaproteobacteria bacterium]|nr:hypothetical protein [Betaproteobacteria bacterium]